MTFPWANTLLLALITAEVVTGYFGLVSGSPDRAFFMQAHGIAGYGIVAVLAWKGANIVRSLRWRRRTAPRLASLTLLATMLVVLVSGLLWTLAAPYELGLFSGVSWHIYVGAALVPILLWHFPYHTRGFPLRFWAELRSFMRLEVIGAAGFGLWQLAGLGARIGDLSGADRRFTGSYAEPERRDGGFPVVSWLNDDPDSVDANQWSLRVWRGDRPATRAFSPGPRARRDARRDDRLHGRMVLHTGVGWHASRQGVGDGGTRGRRGQRHGDVGHGILRRFSLDEARGYLLATDVAQQVAGARPRLPLRLVAPGKRGFEWVKWVESIEVNRTPKWLQPPLPLQ